MTLSIYFPNNSLLNVFKLFNLVSKGKTFAQIVSKGRVAEWSKALALGASPKGRGFEPHLYHTFCRNKLVLNFII